MRIEAIFINCSYYRTIRGARNGCQMAKVDDKQMICEVVLRFSRRA